jgi:predicted component of type VI protein secretion system
MRRVVLLAITCVLLAGCEHNPKEEDPGWDCETQGNQVCGPSDETLTMEAL